jgi:hypothetical protein
VQTAQNRSLNKGASLPGGAWLNGMSGAFRFPGRFASNNRSRTRLTQLITRPFQAGFQNQQLEIPLILVTT